MPKPVKQTKQTVPWLGTDDAWRTYLTALEAYEGQTPHTAGIVLRDGGAEEDDEQISHLLTVESGVGIVEVKGVLTHLDKWYNRYAGLVSYNEIRLAIYQAAMSEEVQEILVDLSSPGGVVWGLLEAVSAMDQAASLKRLTVYSDSIMASAGYWLGLPARQIVASPIALVGSIGVTRRHIEFSKMNKLEGVTETVLRVGKYKALFNSSEPLTKTAVDDEMQRLQHLYGLFVQAVSQYRKTGLEAVQAKMADGREFIGSQALDVGLVDSISTFDETFARIQARVAKQQGGGIMPKKTYTMAAAVAAAAAASVPEDLKEILQTGAQAIVPGAEGDPPAGEGSASEDSATSSEGAAAGSGSEATTEQLTALQTQLEEKAAELTSVTTELSAVRGELAEAKVALDAAKAEAEFVAPLVKIAASVTNNMAVALGRAADASLLAASPEKIIGAYEAALASFQAAFKTGGVSSPPSVSEQQENKSTKVTRLDEARMRSASTKSRV